MHKFEELSNLLGKILVKKNEAYGDAFIKVTEILKIMFPNGIENAQIPVILYLARILDKCNRLANNNDPAGENPAFDIAGYSILELARHIDSPEDLQAFKDKFKDYL